MVISDSEWRMRGEHLQVCGMDPVQKLTLALLVVQHKEGRQFDVIETVLLHEPEAVDRRPLAEYAQ